MCQIRVQVFWLRNVWALYARRKEIQNVTFTKSAKRLHINILEGSKIWNAKLLWIHRVVQISIRKEEHEGDNLMSINGVGVQCLYVHVHEKLFVSHPTFSHCLGGWDGTYHVGEIWDFWKTLIYDKLEGDRREKQGKRELQPVLWQLGWHSEGRKREGADEKLKWNTRHRAVVAPAHRDFRCGGVAASHHQVAPGGTRSQRHGGCGGDTPGTRQLDSGEGWFVTKQSVILDPQTTPDIDFCGSPVIRSDSGFNPCDFMWKRVAENHWRVMLVQEPSFHRRCEEIPQRY